LTTSPSPSRSAVRKLIPGDDEDSAAPVDCLHRCTLGVKRADSSLVSQLSPHDLRNSHRFADFLRQLQKEGAVAIVAPDKHQRFGVLRPPCSVDRSSGGEEYRKDEFAAELFVGTVEEVKSFLAGRSGDESVSLDHHQKQSSSWEKAYEEPSTSLWESTADEGSHETSFGNGNTGFGSGFDAWIPSASDSQQSGLKRKRSDEEDGDSNFHADTGAAAADDFYSNLQRELDNRADSRLFHMRAFNNWVKATQIQELDPKSRLPGKKGTRGPLRVLDLACGKGGDLGKWTSHVRGVGNYVGIDVARGSLKDAALRARNMRNKLKLCTFTCADLGADVPGRLRSSKDKHLQKLLSWSLQKESEYEAADPQFSMVRGGGIQPTDKFDVVSIQFAIHYMMSSRKRARRFFQTVSELLEIGGNLIATTIDARVAVEHLMDLGLNLHFEEGAGTDSHDQDLSDAVVVVGDGACRIRFEPDTVRQLFRTRQREGNQSIDEDMFGLQYTFTLVEGSNDAAGIGDAVNLPEWLTPIPLLKTLAEETGLELETAENFHEFFANRRDPVANSAAYTALYNMKVLNRNGTMYSDNWEISRLYAALKFRKVRESTMSLDDNYDDNESVEEDDVDQKQPANGNRLQKDAGAAADASEQQVTASTEATASAVSSAKLLPMAMMKAKNAVGKEKWDSLSSEEKKELTQIQLDAMATG
jgi:SAM-dependent methyltransferase